MYSGGCGCDLVHGSFTFAEGDVVLTWMCFWAVQNIPCRTKGCKSTVLPPEAPTVKSRLLAKANQRAKVLHCCCDTNVTDVPTARCGDHSWRSVPSVGWLGFLKSKQRFFCCKFWLGSSNYPSEDICLWRQTSLFFVLEISKNKKFWSNLTASRAKNNKRKKTLKFLERNNSRCFTPLFTKYKKLLLKLLWFWFLFLPWSLLSLLVFPLCSKLIAVAKSLVNGYYYYYTSYSIK